MLRIVIGVVLIAHGIGHSMGPMQMFKVATINPAWQGDSWILTNVAGQGLTQVVGVVLWTLALVGFAALGAVVAGWLPASWWQPLAVGSSILSLAGLVLFPVAFPVFSSIGAAVIDVAVLVAALWLNWTPSDLAA